MTKKQNLRTLVNTAVDSSMDNHPSEILENTFGDSTQIKKNTPVGEDLKSSTEVQTVFVETDNGLKSKDSRLLRNPAIKAYQPSEIDIAKTKALLGERDYFVTILDVFTTNDIKDTPTFKINDVIQFHIIGAVSDILAQLSAAFDLKVIAQDLIQLIPQKIYSFSFNANLETPYFEITNEIPAVLDGVFKLHVILTFGEVEYFCIHDEYVFRIL